MEIVKVLNNNVVVALNKEAEEVILMGNGLGFQMKPCACICEDKIEKVFKLESKCEREQIEKLFSEIPESIIDTAYDIIRYSKENLNKDLKETAFITIADHLNSAIVRDKNKIKMKNFLLWDIKRFFPNEFKVGQKAIDLINKKFQTTLSEDEAGFIALHIVNASLDSGYEDAVGLTQLIEEILTVIKYTLRMDFSENDIYFQRFITHLKFFAQRVLTNQNHVIEDEQNELYELITKQYPEAAEVTGKVKAHLRSSRNYAIPKEEQAYLMIHLARIIDKTVY